MLQINVIGVLFWTLFFEVLAIYLEENTMQLWMHMKLNLLIRIN